MGSALAALFGAIIGASAAIFSGVIVESYKRHCDRLGAASAIAGEIFSILEITKRRRTIENFTAVLPTLDTGHDLKFPNFVGPPTQLDPVAEKYLDKLGLLGGDLPERITTFYTSVHGIRIDAFRLAQGEFDGQPRQKAFLIREDIAFWLELSKHGEQLCSDLRNIAAKPWRPFRISLFV